MSVSIPRQYCFPVASAPGHCSAGGDKDSSTNSEEAINEVVLLRRLMMDGEQVWWCPTEEVARLFKPSRPWGVHGCAEELGCGWRQLVAGHKAPFAEGYARAALQAVADARRTEEAGDG